MKNLYNKRMEIIRLTRVSDDMGGWTETESILYTNEPCRVNWLRGSEKVFFSKDTHFRDAKIYCRVLPITSKDRVKYNGETYEIVNVSDPDDVGKYMIIEIKRIS